MAKVGTCMTDNEIIKALECCSNEPSLNCRNCPYERACNMGNSDMQRDALDLINRQKAEIERLSIVKKEYQELYDELKAENDRLNASIKEADEYLSEGDFANGVAIIINLVKEMTEET